MNQKNLLFNKKKKIYFLKKYFKEFSLNFYFQDIFVFDLYLKYLNINILNINQILNSQSLQIKLNVTQKMSKIKELNDSLIIFKKMTGQKSQIDFNKEKYYIFISLNNNNYKKFLFYFIFYIFPIYKKRNLKNKEIFYNYIINEFNLFVNPQFDFFENILIFINFKFNLKNSFITYMYLHNLKLT